MQDNSIPDNLFKNMMTIRENKTKRISSWDRTGGNADYISIDPHSTHVLADIPGPGLINHFYVTMQRIDFFHYRHAILSMYWDEEEGPSVNVPIGDFFGIPFGQPRFFQSLLISVNPGWEGGSTEGLNIYFPMPFARRAKIELYNDTDSMLSPFWYHINYETLPAVDPNIGYFHACWKRQSRCRRVEPQITSDDIGPLSRGVNLTGEDNYVILNAEGQGNYVGCLLQIYNYTDEWYGEGDDMIFIDGEKWPPSIHGTGTEEIFGGGACPSVIYSTPYCGYIQVDHRDFRGCNAMYKFHVNDPVRFKKSISVTIEHGHANNLANGYTSVAYWYQNESHADLPKIPQYSERIPYLPDNCNEAVELFNKGMVIFSEVSRKARLLPTKRREFLDLCSEIKEAISIADCDNAVSKAGQLHKMAIALDNKA